MTAIPLDWTLAVPILASVLLVQAARIDLREYRIPNQLVLALASLFVLYALLDLHWPSWKWDLGFVTIMFVVLLVFYALGWMGGGDAKLLAVAFLWTGSSGALPFVILLAFFSVLYAIAAKAGWVKHQLTQSRRRLIPFAPSIAGALICTLALRAIGLA